MRKLILALVVLIFTVDSCSKKSAPTKDTVKAGAVIFSKNCARCHGAEGIKSSKTPNLQTINLDKAGMIKSITGGKMDMPAFGKKLSAEEISAVADLLVSWHKK